MSDDLARLGTRRLRRGGQSRFERIVELAWEKYGPPTSVHDFAHADSVWTAENVDWTVATE